MMRGDCLVRTPVRHWSPASQMDEKETHNNDSGISPGRSSSVPSNSPNSPPRPTNSPDSSSAPYTRSPSLNGLYPPSPSTASSPPHPHPEGSLEKLKMALERSSALSFYKNDTKDSDNPMDMGRKEFQCPLCAYTTPYRHRYSEHVSTHYSDKCTLCDFKGQNFMELRSHLADVHGMVGGDVADWADQTDQAEVPSDGMDEDENGRRNKPKNFRCKHCPFVTCTKVDFWEHTKTHIKAEKLLTCTKCPFVTEYKHHLEYHLRNHFGSKPFKCSQCAYSCVNKSMLNSHLKSHSNVYQYRCANCAYATKYCHSLKLHLRKYDHIPDVVLNQDGSPNPGPVIDVYGTRRGPKQKPTPPNNGEKQNLPGGITVPQVPSADDSIPKYIYCQLCEFYTASPEIFNQHIYLHNSESVFAQMLRTNNNIPDPSVKDYFKNIFHSMEQPASPMSIISPQQSPLMLQPASPLNLIKSETEIKEEKSSKKNRRKGKAYKLERIQEMGNDEDSFEYSRPRKEQPLEHKMEETIDNCMEPIVNIHEESEEVKIENNIEDDEPIDVVGDSYKIKIPVWRPPNETSNISETSTNESTEIKTDKVAEYSCNYCDMIFRDVVMYTMHMGYHGYKDPYTCNMCGQETSNRVDFFLHIARVSHT